MDAEQIEIVRALQADEFDALLVSTRRGIKAALDYPCIPFIQEMLTDLDIAINHGAFEELVRMGDEDAMFVLGAAIDWLRTNSRSRN